MQGQVASPHPVGWLRWQQERRNVEVREGKRETGNTTRTRHRDKRVRVCEKFNSTIPAVHKTIYIWIDKFFSCSIWKIWHGIYKVPILSPHPEVNTEAWSPEIPIRPVKLHTLVITVLTGKQHLYHLENSLFPKSFHPGTGRLPRCLRSPLLHNSIIKQHTEKQGNWVRGQADT